MSTVDKDGGKQHTIDAVDDIDDTGGEISTSSAELLATRVVDALVSPTQVVTTSTATTISGIDIDNATVALSFVNNAEDEATDHSLSLQFETLTSGDQHNELYETVVPFPNDVVQSPSTLVENNQTNQPGNHTLFPEEFSSRTTKSGDMECPATITMSSPTMHAVTTQLPKDTVSSASIKPRQTVKTKIPQVEQQIIHVSSQNPSPHSLPTPQRKSPGRPNSTKSTGTLKKGTKRRHASVTTPSSATESSTSTGANQVFSWNDILRVQNLIERCLQQCLSKDEIVATLQTQASVDPTFTAVIWQKLEEQNPSFFKAYNLQLQLKDQVVAFNYLVTQQKEMMSKSLSIDSRSSGYARGGLGARNIGAPSRLGSAGRKAQLEKIQQQQQQMIANEGNTGVGSFSLNAASSSTYRHSAFGTSNQSLPLPSPIKTDLDTHAFFT